MTKPLSSNSPRLFTVDAANRTLPLVSAILADLNPLWGEVTGTQKRIEHLIDSRGLEEGNPYSDELAAVKQSLDAKSTRIDALIDELRDLGVEFKGGSHPHACFPSMLDGKLVYLSWQLGEPEVAFWLDLDEAFTERKSLLPAATSAD